MNNNPNFLNFSGDNIELHQQSNPFINNSVGVVYNTPMNNISESSSSTPINGSILTPQVINNPILPSLPMLNDNTIVIPPHMNNPINPVPTIPMYTNTVQSLPISNLSSVNGISDSNVINTTVAPPSPSSLSIPNVSMPIVAANPQNHSSIESKSFEMGISYKGQVNHTRDEILPDLKDFEAKINNIDKLSSNELTACN
jgi:hypothetical protein